MEIVGLPIRLLDQHQLAAGRVAFDAGGGGKQIADRLKEQQHYVQTVQFREAATDKQAYVNRRAELYGTLQRFLDPDREEGQGQRSLTCCSGEDLRQEVVVPAAAAAFHDEAF
jgi:hypothetical protein